MKFSRGSAILNYRKNANLVNVLCFEKCAKMWILVSVPVGSKNYMQSVLPVTTFCVSLSSLLWDLYIFYLAFFVSVDLAVSEINMLKSSPTIVDLAIF